MKLFNKQAFSITLIFLIVILTIIHFIVKDSCFVTSLFFYTFPLPAIIFLAIGAYLLGKGEVKRFGLVSIVSLSLYWFIGSYQYHTFQNGKDPLEIVFWNANHRRGFSDAMGVNEGVPDVLILVECHEFKLRNVKQQFPEYHVETFNAEIAILSKTPIENTQLVSEKHRPVIVNFRTLGHNFSIVDVPASLALPRKPMLDFAFEHAKNSDVVLGDFNTPLESVHFDSFKQNFQHAFKKRGKGFTETWFWGWPILSLDHIWVTDKTTILSAEKINSPQSDHSMLRVRIER